MSASPGDRVHFHALAPNAQRICVNMSPGTVVTTSIDRLGAQPVVARLDDRRLAVAHLRLDLRRDRDAAAAVRDSPPFVVGEVARSG